MPNPKENLSKCCKAKVRVMGIGESNNYWECSKCGKSCNVLGENQVKCEECKHWIDKEDAQKISVETCGITVNNRFKTCIEFSDELYGGGHYGGYIYFCPMHKKSFDEIIYWNEVPTGKTSENYYIEVPATRMEVDENGRETSRQKIKDNFKGERQRIIEQIRTEERQKIKAELLSEFPKEKLLFHDETKEINGCEGHFSNFDRMEGFNQACREHREVVEKLLKE